MTHNGPQWSDIGEKDVNPALDYLFGERERWREAAPSHTAARGIIVRHPTAGDSPMLPASELTETPRQSQRPQPATQHRRADFGRRARPAAAELGPQTSSTDEW